MDDSIHSAPISNRLDKIWALLLCLACFLPVLPIPAAVILFLPARQHLKRAVLVISVNLFITLVFLLALLANSAGRTGVCSPN